MKIPEPLSAADERLIRNAVDNPSPAFPWVARLYLRRAIAAHDYWREAAGKNSGGDENENER